VASKLYGTNMASRSERSYVGRSYWLLQRGKQQKLSVNGNVQIIIKKGNFILPICGLCEYEKNVTVFTWVESSRDYL